MRFLRFFFIVGYIFWGGMLIHAIGELTLRNAWINIFEIKQVKPTEIKFIPQEKESTKIEYSFAFNGEIYNGNRTVINKIIEERLPSDKEEIKISVNTKFPKTNYIDELGLKTRSGNVGIVLSLIFLAFIGLIDLLGDKDKWLKIYGLKK